MGGTERTLNNKEIVSRALDTIQTSLQTLVIGQLRIKAGQTWWSDLFLPNVRDLPSDVPKGPVIDDNEAREYMDICRLCNLILQHNQSMEILTDGEMKKAKNLLYEMREVRNKKSHSGSENYTASKARESIEILKNLDLTSARRIEIDSIR